MKVKVEKILCNWHRANFAPANWPTIAEVQYKSGRTRRFEIDARDLTRFCDLKSFMLSLLAPANARSVICGDANSMIVYCTAIKIAVLKGGKGY